MFPRWLSKLVKWAGRTCASAERGRRDRKATRALFQPRFEQLEDRIVPSGDPYVLSINRTTPAAAVTNAGSVTYTITFSEVVTAVNAADFQLALGGTVAATVTQVTPVSGAVYTVTVSGITGNGTLVLNLMDNDSIHDLAGNPLGQQNAPADFQVQQTLATGIVPCSVALADVNGDNIPDLLVANPGSDTVSVLLGNGNGTFQAQQTFATGSTPDSVAVGDLTGNGKADLIVANGNRGLGKTVSVLLGNGNGTFQTQQTFAAGNDPQSVAVGDVNGDGIPDIAVADLTSNTVSVLLGNGNGTFQAPQSFATGDEPFPLALADVNGDSKPDIVVANEGDNTVSVLLGNGNGTFQTQQTFATSAMPEAVAVGDVNGDGKPDLLVANYGGKTVSLLLGNGNGTFQTQQTFAAGTQPRSVALADVNGDGIPDLVVANHGFSVASVLLGNGNGTFQAQQTFAAGNEPLSVAVGDVNGDGRPDFIVANYGSNTVSVFLNATNGNFTGQDYVIDTLTPFVQSINRANPVNATTNAASVTFTVTLSQPITGVQSSDFQVRLAARCVIPRPSSRRSAVQSTQ